MRTGNRAAAPQVSPPEARRAEQLAGPLLLAGIAVAGGIALAWPQDSTDYLPAQAEVISTAPCDLDGANDRIRFDLNGQVVRADLDGCGNRVGAILDVEVPDTDAVGSMTVRLAGAQSHADDQQQDRLAAVLFVGAGLGGAFLGWQLRGRVARVS